MYESTKSFTSTTLTQQGHLPNHESLKVATRNIRRRAHYLNQVWRKDCFGATLHRETTFFFIMGYIGYVCLNVNQK